jgi:hypothetical protein
MHTTSPTFVEIQHFRSITAPVDPRGPVRSCHGQHCQGTPRPAYYFAPTGLCWDCHYAANPPSYKPANDAPGLTQAIRRLPSHKDSEGPARPLHGYFQRPQMRHRRRRRRVA